MATNDVFTRATVRYVDTEQIVSRKGDQFTLVVLKAEDVGLIKCFVPQDCEVPSDLLMGDELIASFALRTDARLSLGLALVALDRPASPSV